MRVQRKKTFFVMRFTVCCQNVSEERIYACTPQGEVLKTAYEFVVVLPQRKTCCLSACSIHRLLVAVKSQTDVAVALTFYLQTLSDFRAPLSITICKLLLLLHLYTIVKIKQQT